MEKYFAIVILNALIVKITVFVLYSLISTKIYDDGKLVTSLDFFFFLSGIF